MSLILGHNPMEGMPGGAAGARATRARGPRTGAAGVQAADGGGWPALIRWPLGPAEPLWRWVTKVRLGVSNQALCFLLGRDDTHIQHTTYNIQHTTATAARRRMSL